MDWGGNGVSEIGQRPDRAGDGLEDRLRTQRAKLQSGPLQTKRVNLELGFCSKDL